MFKRRADNVSLIIVHVGVGQRCRAQDVESPATLPSMGTRDVPTGRWMKVQGMRHSVNSAGRWIKVQGKLKRRAHLGSLVRVHVGVGQRCRAVDTESPAILPSMSTRNVPAGRWMIVQGNFRGRAHIASFISVHVGVGQRCRARDVEPPASLPITRAHVTFQQGAG
eukprot:scaffold23068_cov70-Phaeocystis_antarctica.AAC.2